MYSLSKLEWGLLSGKIVIYSLERDTILTHNQWTLTLTYNGFEASEGCSPPQELEISIYIVFIILKEFIKYIISHCAST